MVLPTVPSIPSTRRISSAGPSAVPIIKNKLFFFADYEGIRRHTAQPLAQASLLTPDMLQGNFSALLTSGTPIQLYDTQNSFAPYANDQIPVVNPVAAYLAAHPEVYPAPNRTPFGRVDSRRLCGAAIEFCHQQPGRLQGRLDAEGQRQTECVLLTRNRQRLHDRDRSRRSFRRTIHIRQRLWARVLFTHSRRQSSMSSDWALHACAGTMEFRATPVGAVRPHRRPDGGHCVRSAKICWLHRAEPQ